MEEITEWLDPNIRFNTEYGIITNRDWLEKEKKRIEKNTGRMCKIIKRDEDNWLCLTYIKGGTIIKRIAELVGESEGTVGKVLRKYNIKCTKVRQQKWGGVIPAEFVITVDKFHRLHRKYKKSMVK